VGKGSKAHLNLRRRRSGRGGRVRIIERLPAGREDGVFQRRVGVRELRSWGGVVNKRGCFYGVLRAQKETAVMKNRVHSMTT